VKDKFWNFLFYKFIFVFGVMNVQTMEEVVRWVAWFTVLGFFHLLTQLAKDRFEYVSNLLCETVSLVLHKCVGNVKEKQACVLAVISYLSC